MTFYCILDYHTNQLQYEGEQAGAAASAMVSGTVIGYSEKSGQEARMLAEEKALIAQKRFLDRLQHYG